MNNKNNNKKQIVEYIAQPFDVRGGAVSTHEHTTRAYKVLQTKQLDPDYNWEGLARNVNTPLIPYFHEDMGRNTVSLEDYITFLKEVSASNKDKNAEVYFKSFVGTRFYKEMCNNLHSFDCAPEITSEDGSKSEYVLTVQVPELQWVFKDTTTGRVLSKTQKPGVENSYIKIDSNDTKSILEARIALQNALATSENPNNYNTMVGQQYADHTQQEDFHAIISGRGC